VEKRKKNTLVSKNKNGNKNGNGMEINVIRKIMLYYWNHN
jgi:hypothetical protein